MNDFSPNRMPEAAAVSLAQQKLNAMKTTEHSRCLLCGKDNPIGLKLDFRVVRPGMVLATFPCSRVFQSYPETLHGGVIVWCWCARSDFPVVSLARGRHENLRERPPRQAGRPRYAGADPRDGRPPTPAPPRVA